MSSMENEDFIKQTIQAGVRAYLSKPFTRETLEKVAKSVLG
jgi:DNA-binding NarL/FixJ family response regulator